jgi:hypothetical protein
MFHELGCSSDWSNLARCDRVMLQDPELSQPGVFIFGGNMSLGTIILIILMP